MWTHCRTLLYRRRESKNNSVHKAHPGNGSHHPECEESARYKIRKQVAAAATVVRCFAVSCLLSVDCVSPSLSFTMLPCFVVSHLWTGSCINCELKLTFYSLTLRIGHFILAMRKIVNSGWVLGSRAGWTGSGLGKQGTQCVTSERFDFKDATHTLSLFFFSWRLKAVTAKAPQGEMFLFPQMFYILC